MRETLVSYLKQLKIVTEATSSDIDKIYPVGLIVWFAQNKIQTLFSGNYLEIYWENRTIRLGKADGTDIMSVGGADAVKLTQENLPAHNHAFSANTSSFDHGNKGTDWFDYGTKSTDVQELTSIHICNRITLMAMVPLAANLVCHHPFSDNIRGRSFSLCCYRWTFPYYSDRFTFSFSFWSNR